MKSKNIVIISMMSAILLTVQITLAFLPNVELVTLLIILFTIVFGKKTAFIISIFVLVEGMIYGFGLWWLNYWYIWFILFVIAHIFRKNRSALIWAVISGFYGLAFGALCSILYLFVGGPRTAIASWVSGIPFDITHGVSNFIVALILFQPLYKMLNKINSRYWNTI